jgi:hypothetical protein
MAGFGGKLEPMSGIRVIDRHAHAIRIGATNTVESFLFSGPCTAREHPESALGLTGFDQAIGIADAAPFEEWCGQPVDEVAHLETLFITA